MKVSNYCQLKRKCVSPYQADMYVECPEKSLNNSSIFTKHFYMCAFALFFLLGGSTTWDM